MRMLLMFDLPTLTVEDKRNYRKFRNFLLSEGFIMHQFSVYSKILLNGTANNLMIARLKERTPKNGLITLLTVTENQFSKMIYLSGTEDTRLSNSDMRIVFLGEGKENDD